MKRREWGTRIGKDRLIVWLDKGISAKVKAEARSRSLSVQKVLQTCIYERFDELSQEERDALIVRRLNRLDLGHKTIRHSVDILAEALASYVRMWLAHTHEVPESQREVAAIQAHVRFERYLATVSKQLQRGENSFREASKEVVLEDADFDNQGR